MCAPVLIAATLEELGCFDEKKEQYKKEEVRDGQREQDNLKNSAQEEK
ncbi:MAG: hypothetical protein WBD99_03085 [Thermodesulfobacteriota bacterium]